MQLTSALDALPDIERRLGSRLPAVFLDYDGTLTPIVARPEQAVLSDEMRATVRDLAGLCPVAVVSGRDRRDVESLVDLELVYAGSHGFDIAGPDGLVKQHDDAARFLPILGDAETALRDRLELVPGALVERKRFSIAVHFRNVAAEDARQVEQAVDATLAKQPQLRKNFGKKVFELQPRLDWHKGKAVQWLLEALRLESGHLPLYIGDDVTDEDAFAALTESGIGIVVQDEPAPTKAHYVLKDTGEVQAFLGHLAELLEGRR